MEIPKFYNNDYLQQFIKDALHEDIRTGDHSTLCSISPEAPGKAVLKIKENGVLAGVEIAKQIFTYLQPDAQIICTKKDGDTVAIGEQAFEVQAKVHTILQAERLALNIMQRMSGIATLTQQYVKAIGNNRAQLLDTRKTTPLFRYFEKLAVHIGGGANHRFGLYDMIMLKDNHIDYCGGITKAIQKANAYKTQNHLDIKIEIETRSLDDVQEVLNCGGVDRIMLDNFTPENLKKAVELINDAYESEASGGINLQTIKTYADTGVQFISAGAIIHHAVSMDLSLKAIK